MQWIIAMQFLALLPRHGVATAIVREEKHISGILQSQRPDLVQDHADTLIHITGHGCKLRHRVFPAGLCVTHSRK